MARVTTGKVTLAQRRRDSCRRIFSFKPDLCYRGHWPWCEPPCELPRQTLPLGVQAHIFGAESHACKPHLASTFWSLQWGSSQWPPSRQSLPELMPARGQRQSCHASQRAPWRLTCCGSALIPLLTLSSAPQAPIPDATRTIWLDCANQMTMVNIWSSQPCCIILTAFLLSAVLRLSEPAMLVPQKAMQYLSVMKSGNLK